MVSPTEKLQIIPSFVQDNPDTLDIMHLCVFRFLEMGSSPCVERKFEPQRYFEWNMMFMV